MVGAAAIAFAATLPLFETLRWTASGAELEALSSQPSACLAFDAADTSMVQAGQALFNTPTLLGGQAAKAGLSCASCHVNGRDNPHFILSGISEKAGTSDVTNSFFSAARSNGRFDPVAIPDLAAAGKISRDPESKALENFIRTLIVEEFAGHEPSPDMLEALTAYVRSIQPCPGSDKASAPRTLDDQLGLTKAALDGAIDMAKRGDMQASRALIGAARHQLGLISERFVGNGLKAERTALLQASRALQSMSDRADKPTLFAQSGSDWLSQFLQGTAKRLKQKERKSLYNPDLLAAKLQP